MAEGILWLLALAALWAVLNPGDRKSWLVGVPAVGLGALLALRLRSPVAGQVSLQGAVRFLIYFIWQSLRGGWDVAWRALHPRLPLSPGISRYQVRLPAGPERILFLNATSLLPGTVSAGLEGDTLILHTLDDGPAVAMEMAALETRVGDVFALELPAVEQSPL